MLNFKDLGDMTKIASQAKELQQIQQRAEEKKMEILSQISRKLDEIIAELRKKG